MKRLLKFFGILFGCILWLLDPDNILLYILVPAGIAVFGIWNKLTWGYYVAAFGIYAAVLYGIHLIGNRIEHRIEERMEKKLKEREKD